MAEQTHPEMLKVKYPMPCDNLEGELGLEVGGGSGRRVMCVPTADSC